MDYLIEHKVFTRAMKFSRMDMLFLIWAVPAAVLMFIYGNRKRRKILSCYCSPKGLEMLVPNADQRARQIKNFLILLILTLIAVSLSGPQYGYRWEEIERKGIDIIVALDCSKSMLATDIKPSRLDRAKREIYDLLNILKGDRIGLVAYSGTSFLQCPLTMDYSAFHIFLSSLTPDMMPVGGTNISEALLTAQSSFDEKAKSDKAIILITDGDNTGGDPVEAAQALAKANIRLFAIGIGTDSGVPVPETQGGLKKDKSGNIVLSKLDEELLKKIAVLTGGAYVRSASGGMSLDEIYTKEIRGKLEAATLSGGRRQVWEDRYQWVLALAILAFIIEIFLSSEKTRAAILILHVALCTLYCPSAFAGSAQQAQEAYQKGEYDKSLKLFIDAQLENPDKPEISYNIGNAYYKSGRYDEAAKNFKQALQSQNPQLRQKALYNLGNSNYKNNNLDEAVKNYEEAIKLDPKDTQAKDNLEFVKKVIEQKKQQQNEQNQKDKDKSDKKDQKENKDSDKDKSDKDNKDKKDSGDTSEKGDNKPTEEKGDSGKPDPSQEKSEEQQASSDKPSDKKEDTQTPGNEKDGEKQDQPHTPESKPDPQSESVAAPSDKPSENGEAHRQAERALNRLNDQPGKAMIPVYQKRVIEKDW